MSFALMSMVAVFIGACAAASAVYMILELKQSLFRRLPRVPCAARTGAGRDWEGMKRPMTAR
jgi:hypothetical protein